MRIGAQLTWNDLFVGMKASHSFVADEKMMSDFLNLSQDNSCIHRDDRFAQHNDFKGRVVYGALMLAHLSYVSGMIIPGEFGVSANWTIQFHNPLYMNEKATIEGEIVHLSEALRIVKLKFNITHQDRLIASGTAQSKVLNPL